jgi:hypothetical protein
MSEMHKSQEVLPSLFQVREEQSPSQEISSLAERLFTEEAGQSAEKLSAQGPIIKTHFWFTSRPFFQATLGIAWRKHLPSQDVQQSEDSTKEIFLQDDSLSNWRVLRVSIFSPYGKLVNSILVEVKGDVFSEIALEPLIEELPFQNGMRHGLLEVESASDVELRCFGKSFSSHHFPIPALHILKGGNTCCLPMTALDHSQHVLLLANPSSEGVSDARIRVLASGKHKDIVCELGPRSIEMIAIEAVFGSLIQKAKLANCPNPGTNPAFAAQGVQVYVRISARGDTPLAMQFFEQPSRDERKPMIQFLSFP